MKILTYLTESFDYYKEPAMLIAMPNCTFKCCREAGLPLETCQNHPWALRPRGKIDNDFLIKKYQKNLITRAIVFSGLEPLDSREDVYSFISDFRRTNSDPIIIYTGYKEDEIPVEIETLSKFPNIIVKFGRYIQNDTPRYDPILGVTLASSNQYAKQIS